MHLATSAPEFRVAIAPVRTTATDETVAALESLRQSGQFDAFVAATLQAAEARPQHAAVNHLAIEALLASGANERAAQHALQVTRAALECEDSALAVRALRLWVVAMLRLGHSLDDVEAGELLCQIPSEHAGAALVDYWVSTFRSRRPFDLGQFDRQLTFELSPTKAADGTIWADLNAVEVATNGVLQPMVFIDTGAQHTIMTLRAAENAGVEVQEISAELVGFAELEARPALLETLELGGLVLHNVPVLVGNAPALMSAKGQMAIGTELMHHVRFTLDYPARRVSVTVADRAAESGQPPVFEWPVWTFSQACLAQAETDRGRARVMVDTGNRSGTYVSARWARQHLPQYQHPTSNLVFKFRHQGLSLDTMEMGNLVMPDWPIWDRIPRELEQLDLVDVLVGRDLLWPYRLSIDLANRSMRLEGGPQTPTPPEASIP